MKTGIDATTVPVFRQRRPAQLAERELQHLEMILANFAERNTASERLPAKYWDMRIAQLDAEYDLVPSQSQRVASLQRKLASLDSALDSASSAADVQEGQQSRRAAA
ncbi:hypothetical protein [Caballeronia ptereochthonis]|uniref:Uncharacterized protein n=1 Tax=Caballeronia ptereochthonis TaxID=1777144 RepID=A0A157ZDA7_9BURK|nr:hypothetical protein [Caballeronia ptereochthonis]SAK43501.1 hypothetical protein AWB83_00461 [Caballeronia ptereochthonis]